MDGGGGERRGMGPWRRLPCDSRLALPWHGLHGGIDRGSDNVTDGFASIFTPSLQSHRRDPVHETKHTPVKLCAIEGPWKPLAAQAAARPPPPCIPGSKRHR